MCKQEIYFLILDGKIKNIKFNNISVNTNASTSTNIGVLGYCFNATIDNVHVDKFIISSTKLNNNSSYSSYYLGGIVAQNDSSTNNGIVSISKSSVSNFEVTVANANQVYIGGIGGSISFGYIDKCFVENMKVNVKASEGNGAKVNGISSYSKEIINSYVKNMQINIEKDKNNGTTSQMDIGGIGNSANTANCFVQGLDVKAKGNGFFIGGIVSTGGSAKNCYVSGKISVEGDNGWIGGIVGWQGSYSSYYRISNCYSNVDIQSKEEKSESVYIGGIAGSSSVNRFSYISNNLAIGSLYSKQGIVNRIVGDLNKTNKNYSYDGQKINGLKTDESNGGTILTTEQLMEEDTYKAIIGFSDNYSYEGVGQGILPKLYNTEKDELLPNQEDIKLEKEENNLLEILSIEATKNSSDTFRAGIKIYNPNNLEITGLQIDDAELLNIKNVGIQGNNTEIIIDVKVNYYYDSYSINKIMYKENNEEKELEILPVRIDLIFYKQIANYNEWSKIRDDTYENYVLIGDVNYSDAGNKPKENVNIGRLNGGGHKIYSSDTAITLQDTLIQKVQTEIENVKFENINIETSSGNYRGIIGVIKGDIRKCEFSNIKINANNSTSTSNTNGYIACIGKTFGSLEDIKLDNINITGGKYRIGGLVASVGSVYTVDNFGGTRTSKINRIEANNITINTNGSDSGGIIAYIEAASEIQDIIIKDSSLTSKDDAGGIAGYSGAGAVMNNMKVENCKIIGESSVGGIAGSAYVSNSSVIKTQVIGKGSSSYSYVGGAVGLFSGITATSIDRINVIDTSVSGPNYVGGIVGYVYGSSTGTIRNTFNNAEISLTGNNSNACLGGIIGYLKNSSVTSSSTSYIYNNIVATKQISSNIGRVGGLIGYADQMNLYYSGSTLKKMYYNNLIEAQITGPSTTAGIVIGDIGKGDKSNMLNTYVYKYSTINGIYPTEMSSEITYVKGIDLAKQSTYTNGLGFSTAYWDFTTLAKGKYPILKGIDGQTGIDLPTDSDTEGMLNSSSGIMTMSLDELDKEETIEIQENTELPYVDIYQVSANEINIEFSGDTQNVEFSISNNIATNKVIEEQVYTLKYDFRTPLEIIVTNTITGESKTYEIKPEDLIKTIGIQEGTYYYIEENALKSNKGEEQGKYINLYEDVSGKVTGLTEEGKVVQLSNGNVIESTTTNALEETSKPRYEFTYNGSIIRTYRNYSQIITGEETVTRDKQIYVKQNKMYIIDPKIGMKYGNLVIDSYNGKEYETMLGKDGKIYNLKEEIVLPEGIENEKIEEITNNIGNEYNEVMIRKKDKIYVIDYITGEIKYETELNSEEEKVGLLEYITDKWNNELLVSEEAGNNYSQTQEVITKLEETSIEEAKGIIAENNGETEDSGESTDAGETSTNRNYVSSYNSQTGGYDIYSEKEILDTNKEEVETENSKIEQTEGLKQFYYNSAESKKSVNNYGMIYIILIIGAIFVVLRKLNKR